MQEAVPAGTGAMAAVLGADDAMVAEVCALVSGDTVVVPANFNSPGQIVIGGHADALDRALAELSARGIRKLVKLAVSVPSHTPLMRGAAQSLGEVMAGMSWNAPDRPVIQNADASIAPSTDAIRDALVRQLYLPVRWTECVQALAAGGATRVVECGPGKVLSGLVKRIDKGLDARAIGGPTEFELALAELAWVAP
jgi:[acyl-carrier-protein] S-malonyltransferase